MTENEIARQHGFSYSRQCTCATPGDIYKKGYVELTIYINNQFMLKRPGNHKTTGRIEDLERVLNQYGL